MKQEETNIKAAFYIPFAYLYCVRLRSIAKFLSWLLLYILPTAFYASVSPVPYILVLFATFSLYELGYIFNDAVAVRRETNPSLRLTDTQITYFLTHRWAIILTRVLIAALCLYLLSFVHCTLYIVHCTLSLALMCLLFALYNRWRNRYNVILYVWLVFSRYLPFMCLAPHSISIYVLLFVSYPLLIGLERFSMPAYRWPFMRPLIPNEEAKALFRVAYYLIILLLLVPYCYYTGTSFYFLAPIIILALYRILRLIIDNKQLYAL